MRKRRSDPAREQEVIELQAMGMPERKRLGEAVEAAFRRCTPMHFSTGMAGAIAGRPLVIRFFDDRIMTEHFKQNDGPGK